MTATMIKTQDAQPMGEYTRTALDDRKDAADVLIVGISGNRRELRSKVALRGLGIQHIRNDFYLATESAINRIRAKHSVECDF